MALDFLHEQETDHKLEELHPSELHLYHSNDILHFAL
jgi:hypothetical protein